jgi:hypothetical protein
MQRRDECITLLYEAVEDFKDAGKKRASSERAYRIGLSDKVAKIRATGEKVSIIGDLARGYEDVADLRMQRDMDDVLYEAERERIWVLKKDLAIISGDLEREWRA